MVDTPHPPKMPPVARLKSLEDVRRYLARLINELRRGEVDPAIAGKVGFLCNVLISIIKDGDLEGRLAAIEAKLNGGMNL